MLNDHHESSWSAFLLAVFGTEKLTSGMVIHHHPSIFIGISVYIPIMGWMIKSHESLGNYWKCTADNGKTKTTSLLIYKRCFHHFIVHKWHISIGNSMGIFYNKVVLIIYAIFLCHRCAIFP